MITENPKINATFSDLIKMLSIINIKKSGIKTRACLSRKRD